MKCIKELLLKVVPMEGEDGDLLPSLHTQQDIEKFAELIIRECVKAVSFSYKNEDYDSEWDAALREAESNVKQHFGVE